MNALLMGLYVSFAHSAFCMEFERSKQRMLGCLRGNNMNVTAASINNKADRFQISLEDFPGLRN